MTHGTMLCHPDVTALDRRMARLADFLGVECDVRLVDAGSVRTLEAGATCVLASATTLGSLIARPGDHGAFVRRLLEGARSVLVYGFRPTAADAATLRYLSGGLLDGVRPVSAEDGDYRVAADWRALTREFTGLSFPGAQTSVDAVFSASPASALRPIVSIGGKPAFVALTRGACTLFLLASHDVADPDLTVRGEFQAAEWFSRVIPAAMVVRHAFGPRAWHNPRPTASFIIDDPLLKERYGFLRYRDLLRATDHQPFAATIAFIPFNFRRNAASVVDLFRARRDRLGLCIHGCDHTGGEFATADLAALNAMSRLAADRMQAHQAATTLPHGRVMVFPQGRFSPAALRALRANGYAAAVNTSPLPDGAGPGHHLSLREWLEPAVTRYHGFPLFVRRYPRALADFAFDLFMGRPLLAVEHHTAFRDGYGGLADFVAALNALNPDLHWAPLDEALAETVLHRRHSSTALDARVWSNRSLLRHDGSRPVQWHVVKDETPDAPVRAVTMDGRSVPFVLDGSRLCLSLEVEAGAAPVLEVAYANDLPSGARRRRLHTTLAVHARRRLSELRDELVSRRPRLRRRARPARTALPGERS